MGSDEICLQLSGAFDCPSEIVAVDERLFEERRRLLLTTVPSTERPHPIGVRPPLARGRPPLPGTVMVGA